MFKRSACTLLGGAALALTSVVGLGSPAQAATGALILDPMTFTPGTTHVLPQTVVAGDCRETGENQGGTLSPSNLVIQNASVPNLYTITWNATLYTVDTSYGDKWHAKFVFRDASGPIFAVLFDGPSMGQDKIYQTSQSVDVPLSPDQVSRVRFVDWIGDC
jgi:hypothetical protein